MACRAERSVVEQELLGEAVILVRRCCGLCISTTSGIPKRARSLTMHIVDEDDVAKRLVDPSVLVQNRLKGSRQSIFPILQIVEKALPPFRRLRPAVVTVVQHSCNKNSDLAVDPARVLRVGRHARCKAAARDSLRQRPLVH